MEVSTASSTEFITYFEGFRSMPYQDQDGIWTIGYGTTRNGQHVTAQTPPITKEQAMDYSDVRILKNIRRI